MGTSAISTHDISRTFGPITAVDHLSLDVPAGSVFGFLGPNGSGKTTTIRMLLGLIRPSGGTIRIFDHDAATSRKYILSRVGSMVESPALYGHLTGRENLEINRKLCGVPQKDINRILGIVGLTRDADRPTKQYSLGMRQRLGLALALLGKPELLILDEPTNGLDPAGIREMRELIRDIPRQTGVTVFLSSHLLGEVQQIATHVGILNKGKLLFHGPLGDLQTEQKRLIEIEASPMDKIVATLRKEGWAISQTNGNLITVVLSPDGQSADIARLLVNSGIDVHQLRRVEHSLEALFLQMTDTQPTNKEAEAGS